jgi:PAS domain S-box-containing protein
MGDFLDMPTDNLAGRMLAELVLQPDVFQAQYQHALRYGTARVDISVRRTDGAMMDSRWDLVRLPEEGPEAVLAVVTTCTPGEEERLATEHARLAGILAAMPAALFTVDGTGQLVDANPAAAHLAGLALSDLPGRPCREVFPLRDEAGRALCDWACPRARGKDHSVHGAIRAFLQVNGSLRTVDWSCRPLHGTAGEPLGWVEVVQDVSHSGAVETMRETLLSAVTHELLTPVAIIKGHAETLRDPITRSDASLADGALEAIDEEAERLRRLVANVIDAARATSGVFRIERNPLALGPLIERVVRRFHGRSRRHTFTGHTPPDLPLVLGDRERLESVLYNLLDNAVKYSPRGGQVNVDARVHNHDVEVVIEDEGVGVRRSDHLRIFEAYYRADSGARPPAEGSGLGLYICKTIIEAHGGRIWIDSRPERGASMHFSVPRVRSAQLPSVTTPREEVP